MQNIGEPVSLPSSDLLSRLDVPVAGAGGAPMMPSTSSGTPGLLPPQLGAPAPAAPGGGTPMLAPPPAASPFDPARMGGVDTRLNRMLNVASLADAQGLLNMQTNQYEAVRQPPERAPLSVPRANPIPLSVETLSVQPEQTMHIVPMPLPLAQIPRLAARLRVTKLCR